MAKLKIAGTWSGVIEMELEEWTIPMLREEVAKRSNCVPDSINLIFSGKLLKDGEGNQKLSELGLKNNSKILSSRVSVDEGKLLKQELVAEDERSTRLSRVKAAAVALSKRHAEGSLPVEDFNLELEDQSGQKVHLGSDTDQQAVMMGLMLHTNAKQLIKMEKYKDALEVLNMGEEAFSLCNPKVIEMVDNVPILQIDMVWCYFMLQDVTWLSEAGIRLAKARKGLERAHGKDSSRVRILQQGRYPELALQLRLDLLDGVVAYHSGQFVDSRNSLISAKSKYLQLQVPDEALSMLMGMGYKERESKRALRMSNQDIEMAIDFLVEEKAKKAKKREEDQLRQREIMEQQKYGMTPLRKAVSLEKLKELVSIGFEKDLAAEALRRNENDEQKALDDLTDPETNAAIQGDIESRKAKRQRQAINSAIEDLVSMGFDRSKVVQAVQDCGTREHALNQLLQHGWADTSLPTPNGMDTVNPTNNNNVQGSLLSSSDEGSSRAKEVIEDQRDKEMENLLANELQQHDAFSDYDIEVTKEGEAINLYLEMLAASGSTNKGSSSQ